MAKGVPFSHIDIDEANDAIFVSGEMKEAARCFLFSCFTRASTLTHLQRGAVDVSDARGRSTAIVHTHTRALRLYFYKGSRGKVSHVGLCLARL